MATRKKPVVETTIHETLTDAISTDENLVRLKTEPMLLDAEKILSVASGAAITNHIELVDASEFLIMVKTRQKEYEEQKDPITRGLRDTLAKINALFAQALKPLEKAEDVLKVKVRDYHIACEHAADQRQAMALEVDKVDHERAVALMRSSDDVIAPAVPGISFQGRFDWELVDAAQLPEEFWKRVPDVDKIDALVQERRAATKIPGVLVVDKRIVKVSTARRAK